MASNSNRTFYLFLFLILIATTSSINSQALVLDHGERGTSIGVIVEHADESTVYGMQFGSAINDMYDFTFSISGGEKFYSFGGNTEFFIQKENPRKKNPFSASIGLGLSMTNITFSSYRGSFSKWYTFYNASISLYKKAMLDPKTTLYPAFHVSYENSFTETDLNQVVFGIGLLLNNQVSKTIDLAFYGTLGRSSEEYTLVSFGFTLIFKNSRLRTVDDF